MNRWKMTVTNKDGVPDETEISEISDLARMIGAAVVDQRTASVVVVRRGAAPPPPPADDPRDIVHVHVDKIRAELDRLSERGALMMPLEIVRDLLSEHTHVEPEPDPIETGREAALGQWEARWEFLLNYFNLRAPGYRKLMVRVAAEIPTGLPVGERWVPRMTGRVTVQLEPDRVARLIEVLKSAGAHPSGLGSYGVAADALALAEDIANMADGQEGWTR